MRHGKTYHRRPEQGSMQMGTRIELLKMAGDPDPIQPGARGVILEVNYIEVGVTSYAHVSVDWDDGRRLKLVIPPDIARVVKGG